MAKLVAAFTALLNIFDFVHFLYPTTLEGQTNGQAQLSSRTREPLFDHLLFSYAINIQVHIPVIFKACYRVFYCQARFRQVKEMVDCRYKYDLSYDERLVIAAYLYLPPRWVPLRFFPSKCVFCFWKARVRWNKKCAYIYSCG